MFNFISTSTFLKILGMTVKILVMMNMKLINFVTKEIPGKEKVSLQALLPLTSPKHSELKIIASLPHFVIVSRFFFQIYFCRFLLELIRDTSQ